MNKILYTPDSSIQVVNKVKDSKFYGSITRVDNITEVKNFIMSIKKKYHDATHNVSAYKLGAGDMAVTHTDDDGEPAGSSGPPILQAIERDGLTNTLIIITRYFGGTKLGIGGLIRAYGDTARLAIKEAGIKKMMLFYQINILSPYDHIGTVMGQISAFQGQITKTEYQNQGVIVCSFIKPEKFILLKESLIEKTSNKIKIERVSEKYI